MPGHGGGLFQGLLEFAGNSRLKPGGGGGGHTDSGFCSDGSHETKIRQFAGSGNRKVQAGTPAGKQRSRELRYCEH
jgi:hypothetical protein